MKIANFNMVASTDNWNAVTSKRGGTEVVRLKKHWDEIRVKRACTF